MSDDVLGQWKFTELLAVSWSDEMAARFPDATHAMCRQQHVHIPGEGWQPSEPAQCLGWHCNRCGAATNSYGHHDCPDRVSAPEETKR